MQYIGKLYKSSFSHILVNIERCFCKFDNLGTWDNRLTLPLNVEDSVKEGHLIPRISLEYIGKSTLQGRRSKNEDRILMKQVNQNLLILALFDGHGTATAAEFAQDVMEDIIKFWLFKKKMHDLKSVLKNSFFDCNNLMARHFMYYCPVQNRQSGTTATVAILRNSIELAVANVGDSRAILCRDGKAVHLSIDDEPGNESEQRRIHECGGLISTNSLGVPIVNARLGMTRSLGDLELKKFGVICEPHIFDVKVSHGRDAFLVMTTDGVSYVMTNTEVVESVSMCRTTAQAASYLTDQALQYGSEDNVTAVVLPFGSWGKYALDKTKNSPPSFGIGGGSRSRFVVNSFRNY